MICCFALLGNNNSPSISILKCKSSNIFFDVSDFLIVNLVEMCVHKVVLIIFEVLEPGLVIRQNFPVAFPILLGNSPRVVSIHQDQVKFITTFVILSE